MKEVKISTDKGDSSGTIDDMIAFLTESKEKGATHYRLWWSQDPVWSFKWLETFRIKSYEEFIADEVKELQSQIDELSSKKTTQ